MQTQSTKDEWSCLSTITDAPNKHDVLFGRGNDVNFHPGNIYFRSLVTQAKPVWRATPKFDRTSIAKKIVSAINKLDPPGRFLKHDKPTKLWHEVSFDQALNKAKKALREGNASPAEPASSKNKDIRNVDIGQNPEKNVFRDAEWVETHTKEENTEGANMTDLNLLCDWNVSTSETWEEDKKIVENGSSHRTGPLVNGFDSILVEDEDWETKSSRKRAKTRHIFRGPKCEEHTASRGNDNPSLYISSFINPFAAEDEGWAETLMMENAFTFEYHPASQN